MGVLNLLSRVLRGELPHTDHDGAAESTPEERALLSVDDRGWVVGPDVVHIPTRRTQRLVVREPVMVTWHWTATARGTAMSLARRIRDLPRPGERSASWHILIAADGTLIQSASLLVGTWHAGGPSALRFARASDGHWHPSDRGRVSANALGPGIELECGGEVRRGTGDGKWRLWPFNAKAAVIPDDEVETVHWNGETRARHQHAFTDAQRNTAERLVVAINTAYGIGAEAMSWGHVMLDPSRKVDPGSWLEDDLPAILGRTLAGTPGSP